MLDGDAARDVAADRVAALRALVEDGRLPDALEYFGRARKNSLPAPELLLLGATVATRLGRLVEAEPAAQEALALFHARGDPDGRMRALNLLGVIRFERGGPAEAEGAFNEALTLARRLHDTLMAARASNNLASVAHLRGDPYVALALYRQVLLDYLRLGNRRGAAETYHNLGIVHRHLGEWPEADAAADQAGRHAEISGDQAMIAIALSGRAETAIERGDLDMAWREIELASRLTDEVGDQAGAAQVLLLRSAAALRAGDYEAALAGADAAAAAARALEIPLMQAEAAAVGAQAALGLGDSDDAEARRREAADGFSRLGAAGFLERFTVQYRERAKS